MTTKKQKRLDELKIACEESEKADRRAVTKRQKKFRSMLRAHEAGAATYRDLAEIAGVSEIRVAQILREQRERRNGN